MCHISIPYSGTAVGRAKNFNTREAKSPTSLITVMNICVKKEIMELLENRSSMFEDVVEVDSPVDRDDPEVSDFAISLLIKERVALSRVPVGRRPPPALSV